MLETKIAATRIFIGVVAILILTFFYKYHHSVKHFRKITISKALHGTQCMKYIML
jgi:hypothetical protein